MRGQFSATFDDAAKRDDVRRRYEAGETCEQIAKSYGCSSSPVRNVLRMLKVSIRKGGHRGPARTRPGRQRGQQAASVGTAAAS